MSFERLIRFESEEDGNTPSFADIGLDGDGLPPPGTKLDAFKSVSDLINKTGGKTVALRRVCVSSHWPPELKKREVSHPTHPTVRPAVTAQTGLNVGGKSKSV